jgi:uncharacterized protein YecE (DUF72 family)
MPVGPSRTANPDTVTKTGTLRIGTSGWHYASWRGPFYPPDAKPKELLAFYSRRFDTTELNNTFYRLPSEKALAAWRDGTPEDFLFAWKASRMITHMKRLKDVEENIAFVFDRMDALGEKFGPVLFQLPPSLKADAERRERLARCLALLPKNRRHTFEFRDPSWYEPALLDLLRDHDVALCLSDHEAAPAPWEATASFVYIRAHGSEGRYAGHYDTETLRRWSEAIAAWRRNGQDVYVYFDNDIKAAAPGDAEALIAMTRALL